MIKTAKPVQPYVVIEGNIGAGKSTFLKLVKDYLNVQAVFEPHQQWQNADSEYNLLEKFYTDTSRWAYTFQTHAFVTRVVTQETHARNNPYPMQLLERSVFSDRYCFAKNAHENGHMNALEWKLYQEWFSWLVDGYVPRPAGFIYLHVDPDVCYSRLQKRSRKEEATVPKEYLQQLHDKHEKWLIQKDGIADYLQDIPVLTLDGNANFEDDKKELELRVEQIATFLAPILNAPHTTQTPSLSL